MEEGETNDGLTQVLNVLCYLKKSMYMPEDLNIHSTQSSPTPRIENSGLNEC